MTTIRTTRLTLLSLVALALCGLTLFLIPVASPAAPTISWTPKNVSEIVAQGESINIPVSLRSGENLTNVTFHVVPEISPYVSVTPSSIASIGKDETVVVTVSIAPDEDAPVNTFDGTVHVRASTSARTYAKPLPVSVTILEQLPGSVQPDPDMVVTDPEGGIYPVNQVLITLVEGATRADAGGVAALVNGTLLGFVASINTYQVEVPTTTITELNSLIEALALDQSVDLVGTNNLYFPNAALSTDLENLSEEDDEKTRAYEQVKVVKAWHRIPRDVDTNRIVVGIADTGINGGHQEFEEVDGVDRDATDPPSKIPTGNNCERIDTNLYHGTAVAGIIGANNTSPEAYQPPQMNGILAGVPNVDYKLRIAEYDTEALEALYVHEHGLFAKLAALLSSRELTPLEPPPHLMNISYGSVLCDALPEGSSKKNCLRCEEKTKFEVGQEKWARFFEAHPETLFVIGAGNDGIKAANQLPAAARQVREQDILGHLMVVGATDLSDARAILDEEQSSNYGDYVDISAPGVAIWAPAGGSDKYQLFKGTSGAAPMVTGVAAMLMAIDSREPKRSPQEIKKVLKETANTILTDRPLGNGCPPIEGGTGCRLNAERAVCEVLELTCLTMRTDDATAQSGVPTEIDVLANDEPDTLRITDMTQGQHGSVVLSTNGVRDTVTYTSEPGYDDTDMFTYSVVSPEGGIGEAKVNVTVEPAMPSTAFSAGDAVEVTADAIPHLNVRSTANGDLVGTQLPGASGSVVGGPEWVDGYWWWEVDFNEDPDGWVVEDFLQPTGTLPCDAANPVVPCESRSFTADTYIAGVDYPTDDWAVFYDSDITTVVLNADGSYWVAVNELGGSQYEDLWHNGSHYGEAYGVDVNTPPSEWIGAGSGSVVPPVTVLLEDFESYSLGQFGSEFNEQVSSNEYGYWQGVVQTWEVESENGNKYITGITDGNAGTLQYIFSTTSYPFVSTRWQSISYDYTLNVEGENLALSDGDLIDWNSISYWYNVFQTGGDNIYVGFCNVDSTKKDEFSLYISQDVVNNCLLPRVDYLGDPIYTHSQTVNVYMEATSTQFRVIVDSEVTEWIDFVNVVDDEFFGFIGFNLSPLGKNTQRYDNFYADSEPPIITKQ